MPDYEQARLFDLPDDEDFDDPEGFIDEYKGYKLIQSPVGSAAKYDYTVIDASGKVVATWESMNSCLDMPTSQYLKSPNRKVFMNVVKLEKEQYAKKAAINSYSSYEGKPNSSSSL